MDWGLGCYERTAAQLLPAAEIAVEVAGPVEGERVIDLGCGTGNAALIATRRGAQVTGVDPAQRLLEVGAGRARELGLDTSFVQGDAESIPFEDGHADLLISVFGVIFASDAEAAAAEMARVTAGDGRIAITAWIPEGAISQASRVGREAVANALGSSTRPGFAWHDPAALDDLLSPFGFELSVEERSISFTAPSVEDWIESDRRHHPLTVAGAAVLERRGEAQAVFERIREIYEAANEADAAFRVTSRYVIAIARRSG